MALNFPSNPTLNQEYTSGNTTWKWNGIAWNVSMTSTQNQNNSYGIVSVNGQSSLVANSPSDVLNIIAGDNIILTTDPSTDTVTISSQVGEGGSTVVFRVAADDSTVRDVNIGETIQFIAGAGVDISSDVEGNITISSSAAAGTFQALSDANTANLTIDKIYEPAIVMLRVDNTGTSAYTFSHYSGNNPTIYALAGTTIAFDLDAIPGHPFEIQDALGNPYNTGLVHVTSDGTVSTGASAQGKSNGTLYWRVPEGISGGYRYQCQSHAPMVGAITVKRLSVI